MNAPVPVGFAENLRGAGFMSLSMLGFALNDTTMKLLAPDMGLLQAIFIRSVLAFALIGIFAWRFGALERMPPRRDRPWLLLRMVAEVGATLFYLTALMHLPLGNVSAVMQTMPLIITLVGALFLGETVGWRRWAAIIAGFVGVMIIVRPGGESFDPNVLWAFAGIVCFTLRDVATRQVSAQTPSLLITLLTTVGVAIMGAVGVALEGWNPVGMVEIGGMTAAATAVLAGYFFGILAMRMGEIGFISPFRYSVLVWAMLLGHLVFDERPDALTYAGAALIVAAGLYAFFRERRQARTAAQEIAQRSAPPHAMASGAKGARK